MAPLIAGIVTSLIQANLPRVAQAVVDKGLDYVEEKTGIKLEPNMSAEKIAELRIAAQKHEEFMLQQIVDMAKSDQENVSKRWIADMASDSWLSKNIRPFSLMAIFLGYFLFAMMSAFGYNANESYVTLLGNWGILIFGAYFGSRGFEKITEIRSRK